MCSYVQLPCFLSYLSIQISLFDVDIFPRTFHVDSPICDLYALQDLKSSKKNLHGIFYDWMHHLQPSGLGGAVKIFSQRMNELITEVSVEQPLVLPGSAKKFIEFRVHLVVMFICLFSCVIGCMSPWLIILQTFYAKMVWDAAFHHQIYYVLKFFEIPYLRGHTNCMTVLKVKALLQKKNI